ncbi:terminase small subunit [Tepidibacter hydrothermalis]|uniref:Terminase small subunit n=1 Tax=Tepidibacter hydrothermalis TaxID=3036126 RepID=A0ABY8EGU9_9FIRM|nr:terminase small subunit [Tepidibacter hydrothermalis]WFD12001.1 terminase small subunit [Tepidibacter hydrothermalis]
MGVKLTEKQKRFADYYIETGNATEAAIRAGYSKKTARQIGQENLTKPYISKYIQEILGKKEKERIASQDEVLKFLTSVMRGKEAEEVVCPDGSGGTFRELKGSNIKDRVKAAELLGKRYSLFTDKVNLEANVGVTIIDDIGSEEDD